MLTDFTILHSCVAINRFVEFLSPRTSGDFFDRGLCNGWLLSLTTGYFYYKTDGIRSVIFNKFIAVSGLGTFFQFRCDRNDRSRQIQLKVYICLVSSFVGTGVEQRMVALLLAPAVVQSR